MVIDHLKPRSAFPPNMIHIADRTDNLAIACWDCNTVKSNRDYPFRPVLPVIWVCPLDWREKGASDEDVNGWLEIYATDEHHAYCASHRCATRVPTDWPIAMLH
ncbi:hypothetical protein J2Y46_002581 [Microbacterium sp. BE35]|uniref:HNH endonuclease n=1 Tax=Microbacterium sp. BE35 TaxID=2817773 RepID=UPI002862C76D|nr:HNH endonuclease [Microbacterium sp. BE35]MDR7189755.1 hypothetical protein [Microbacterium sp. BE35]